MPNSIRLRTRSQYAVLALLAAVLLGRPVGPKLRAAEPSPSGEYLDFMRQLAAKRWADASPPETLEDWRRQQESIRSGLRSSWGGFPSEPCALEPKKLGELQRDGYRVEKLIIQTRPGVWMTANAYVPDKPGKHPAILAVHGHWKGAKQDPVVQARCIGPVKLGFFVLAVDAFGAGERGIGKALGEYHGEMTGATLFPVGLPLSGLQVYENMRAVDYLRTRPEVDGDRIGITGASGGGNQTMYAGAFDDRFQGVVPVCSVGNYQSYLGGACCMCEVVPGALRYTEEWGVLGLTAPRGLMIVNATRDAPQFSVAEAKKSLARVEPIYRLFHKPENVRHAIFESAHDYNREMREAMYGWMTRHLKGEGDGKPIPESQIQTEDPNSLRCYPGTSRPDDWVTLPRFAAAEGRRLLASKPIPKDPNALRVVRERLRATLVEDVLGGFPPATPLSSRMETIENGRVRLIHFEPEPGIHLTARVESGKERSSPFAVVLDLEGAEKASASNLAAEVRRSGWGLVTLDLRATGKRRWPSDKIGRAPDHNTAEWALWVGRPLLGQWTYDVKRLLNALEEADGGLPSEIMVMGRGPAGVVALCVGVTDDRIKKVAAIGSLASFITEEPYEGQRLGILAPGIIPKVGDVATLAALNAPRRVVIAGGVAGNGKMLTLEQLRERYEHASPLRRTPAAEREITILGDDTPEEVLRALR